MKNSNNKDRWLVRAVWTLGLLLTGTLLAFAIDEMKHHEVRDFESQAQRISETLGSELQAADEVLETLVSVLAISSQDEDSDAFRRISSAALHQQKALRAIGFSAWVPNSQKLDFETRTALISGVAQFQVKSPAESKDANPFSVPIVILEPFNPRTIRWVGLDLASLPEFKKALLSAAKLNETVSTQAVFEPTLKGFTLLKPVYSGRIPPKTEEERQRSLVGFVHLTFQSKDLLAAAPEESGFIVSIRDPQDQELAVSSSTTPPAHLFSSVAEKSHSISVGDLNYQVLVRRTVGFQPMDLSILVGVLFAGLALTFLLAWKISHLLSSHREIQERQLEIEAKVREKTIAFEQSEKLLRQVIDTNPNVIFAQTEDFRIVFANQEFFECFEKSPQEVYGQVINYDLPGQRDPVMRSAEEQILMPNGDYNWFETTRVPIELEGRGPCSLIVAVDISQKKIDEAVIAEQRARMFATAKLSALGEMAGGVAHEINSPLTTILLLSEQISKILKSPEPNLKLIDHHASVITRTAGRISKIVNGLRSFSRDGGSDRMLKFNLVETIEETLSLCREKFYNSGVKLDVEMPEALTVVGRSVQISQALLNLLNNAFDAVRNRPDPQIRIRVQDLDSRVQLAIEDNGSGIDPETRHKIFQPFFTTKETGHGTGLGLSIAKGILESHHGHLHLDETSQMTRFVMDLPKDLLAVRDSAPTI